MQRHHARVEALNFARGQLGQELDIDPLDGVLLAVRLSYGVVDHLRHRLMAESSTELREAYARALTDYSRHCEIAIKAGVAERQIKIIERMADQLSLLFEEIVAVVSPSKELRARMSDAWVQGLARMEAPAIDGTAEDLAA